MATTGDRPTPQAILFARCAACYWLTIFPQVCRELRYWGKRAADIPDKELRGAALDALVVKRGDLEGAVAFAAFAPANLRPSLIRGIAAWEIAFDYLDSISEMPNPDPVANGRTLNQALLTALDPGAAHSRYYDLHMRKHDGGYLIDLVDTCRRMVEHLPSFGRVACASRRIASGIVAYQSLNHGDLHGSHATFADWARSQTVPNTNLKWWEAAAAAGSQLAVLALLTAAASTQLTVEGVSRLEKAYFPWIGALSTLLDSLVDQPHDNAEGQFNLIDYYDSPRQAARRLGAIAREAVAQVRALPDAKNHVLLLAAMAAFFHTKARSADAQQATRAVLAAMGPAARPALAVFRVRYGLAAGRDRAGMPPGLLHDC